MNDSYNIRLETIERIVKELEVEQNGLKKLLEKIYQAELTILSHQKLVS